MKSSLCVDDLKYTIKLISSALNGRCEYFLFFGSLLGIVRDNAPIPGDDDVDFYVNKNSYNEVKCILLELGFQVNYNIEPNLTEHFLQVECMFKGVFVRADFYFYDSQADQFFLEERWNFAGTPNNPDSVLKMPKPLVFPLQKLNYEGSLVFLPQHSEIICEILYGVNWRVPQQKGVSYTIKVIDGRPVLLNKATGLRHQIPHEGSASFFSKFIRKFVVKAFPGRFFSARCFFKKL